MHLFATLYAPCGDFSISLAPKDDAFTNKAVGQMANARRVPSKMMSITSWVLFEMNAVVLGQAK